MMTDERDVVREVLEDMAARAPEPLPYEHVELLKLANAPQSDSKKGLLVAGLAAV